MSIPLGAQPVSPDGTVVAALDPARKATLYPVEGGEAREVPGSEAGEVPARFTVDGRSVFLFRRGELPARVFKVDIATGRRELWREIAPSDPAGLYIGLGRVLPAPDGRSYVYNIRRMLSELYVGEGLR